MASQENDVRDNVMVGIGAGQETCIQDKDIDPLMKLANEENDICNRTKFSYVTKLIPFYLHHKLVHSHYIIIFSFLLFGTQLNKFLD